MSAAPESLAAPAVLVTIFRDRFGERINAARVMALEELERVIRVAPAAAEKKDLPLLKLARFGETRTEKGSLRHDENVLEVHGIEGDYDGEELPMSHAVEALSAVGVAAVLYTSASHEPERPRWRVLVPLREVLRGTTAELRSRRAHFAAVLNALLGGELKSESFALSQSFYFGPIRGRPAPEIVRLSGVCLDELAEAPTPIFPVTSSTRETAPPALTEISGDRSRDLLRRIARDMRAGLADYEIIARHREHPHARDQTDPERAVRRAIERVREDQAARAAGSAAETDAERAAPPDLSALALPSFADLRQMQITEKMPVIRDLLYPGAHLFVGRPKIGKSWMLLQLVLALGEMSAFLGFMPEEPGEVLAIFGEDDDGRIRSRLDTLGCARPPETVRFINQQRLIALAREYGAAYAFPQFLDAYLEAHPAVRCVTVDTETTVRQLWAGERPKDAESARVTETDYQQTRAFDEIALRRHVAILLVNHAAKRRGEAIDLHETINRSNTALAGASGSIVLADPPDADPLDPTQRMRVLAVRARDLRDEVLLAVEQRPETSWFHSLGEYVEVRQTQAEEEILHAIEELMQEEDTGEYITAADVAEHLGKRRETVKRTMTRMSKGNRKVWKHYRIVIRRGRDGGYRLERMGTDAR